MMVAILAIYVSCVIATALLGLIGMIMFSEYGRQDEDYIVFKTWFMFSIIFPYAIYRVIKFKLDTADKLIDDMIERCSIIAEEITGNAAYTSEPDEEEETEGE